MVPPFVEQSEAAGWVLRATVVAFVCGEVATALRRRPRARRVSASAEVALRASLFGAALWLVEAHVLAPDAVISGGPAVFGVGAMGAWSGLLLRWWSVITLGRLFTTVLAVEDDQPLVETGPYRWLRHPSYLGLLLVCAGCGVMVGNWIGLLGSVAIMLAALVFRIRVEESAMRAALGERYVAYAEGRARLVPYVW